MPEWKEGVLCPMCGSQETRFVEPRYENSVYECEACGCSFELEE